MREREGTCAFGVSASCLTAVLLRKANRSRLAIEKVSLIGPLMRCFSLMNYWADPFVTGQLFDLFVMFFVPSNIRRYKGGE